MQHSTFANIDFSYFSIFISNLRFHVRNRQPCIKSCYREELDGIETDDILN